MKTIRLVFAALAIVIAGAAVYANKAESLDLLYFRANNTADTGANCEISIENPGCSGTASQCQIALPTGPGGSIQTFVISVRNTAISQTHCAVVPGEMQD